MRATRITVVGDALVDVLRTPESDVRVAGGSALNVALGLAVLGDSPTLVASLGDDADGDLVREALARHGVELLTTPHPLGTPVATSERVGGEPLYTFNDAARARRVHIGDTERHALDRADLVVVSGFPFDDSAQCDEVLSAIADPEHRLLIDPNPRAGMMHDRALFTRNLERATARSRLLKVGLDDIDLLWSQDATAVARRLAAAGAHQVLCTLGEHGAELYGPGDTIVRADVVPLPDPVVDTMGAGDATLATFAHAMAEGHEPDWELALRRAMLNAAATCRRPGALLQTVS